MAAPSPPCPIPTAGAATTGPGGSEGSWFRGGTQDRQQAARTEYPVDLGEQYRITEVLTGLHPRQPAVVVVAALAQLAQGQARLGMDMTQHYTEQPAGDRLGIYRHAGPLSRCCRCCGNTEPVQNQPSELFTELVEAHACHCLSLPATGDAAYVADRRITLDAASANTFGVRGRE